MTQDAPFANYVGYDLGGFMYNMKYPPNPSMFGDLHHGYATDNQEAFFYDVALYLYGIKFTYNGHRYSIPSDGEGWVLIADDENKQSAAFDNPLELMENVSIEGKRLVDIIDDVSDIVMQ